VHQTRGGVKQRTPLVAALWARAVSGSGSQGARRDETEEQAEFGVEDFGGSWGPGAGGRRHPRDAGVKA
jgi:hypothetical protein